MRSIAFATLALAACTTNNNPPGGDDAPPPPPGGAVPRAGLWGYTEVTPVSSNCPQAATRGEDGNFVIDQLVATSFRIVPADGTDPFTCSLASNGGFDCPDRLAETIDERPSADAVFTIRATAQGTFLSSTLGKGGQDAVVTCAGGDCALTGATFPCQFSVDFDIAAQ